VPARWRGRRPLPCPMVTADSPMLERPGPTVHPHGLGRHPGNTRSRRPPCVLRRGNQPWRGESSVGHTMRTPGTCESLRLHGQPPIGREQELHKGGAPTVASGHSLCCRTLSCSATLVSPLQVTSRPRGSALDAHLTVASQGSSTPGTRPPRAGSEAGSSPARGASWIAAVAARGLSSLAMSSAPNHGRWIALIATRTQPRRDRAGRG
jgi:hypothetical protein